MKFEVKNTLSSQDVESGLRNFTKDALAHQIMTTLTGPTSIIALAIILGVSNLIIWLLVAIPFLAQLIQIPAIYLVEAYRVRRATRQFSILGGLRNLFHIPFRLRDQRISRIKFSNRKRKSQDVLMFRKSRMLWS